MHYRKYVKMFWFLFEILVWITSFIGTHPLRSHYSILSAQIMQETGLHIALWKDKSIYATNQVFNF